VQVQCRHKGENRKAGERDPQGTASARLRAPAFGKLRSFPRLFETMSFYAPVFQTPQAPRQFRRAREAARRVPADGSGDVFPD
jgi:hypothetical protein